MHRHPLRFLLVIAVLLLLPSWARQAHATGAALQFVPSDSMAVVGIDFDKLRTTAVQKTVEQALRKDKDAIKNIEELRKETGFDVFKDIHGLTVVLPEEVLKDDNQFVMILEANINEAKMVKFIEKKDGKALPKKSGANGDFYELDGGRAGLAFRGKFVIIGGMATFEKAIGKNDPAQVFPTLRASVEKEMLWIAGSTTVVSRQKLGKQDANAGKLESFAAGLSIPSGAKMKASAHFSDAAAADTLAKLMTKGLAELGNDSTMQQMGLAELASRVTVSANGSDLSISVDLTKGQIEKIAKSIQALLH